MAAAPDRDGAAKPAPPSDQPVQRITRDLRPAKPAPATRGATYTTKG